MKLNELIQKYSWDDICPAFLRLYPDQGKSVKQYKRVINVLRILRPALPKMQIAIEDIFDKDDKIYYADVHGKDGTLNKESDPHYFKDDKEGNRETLYALEFTSWNEWLGMEIDKSTLMKYKDLEIISHCLYEMTFVGYDQADIKKQKDELNEMVEEIKSMSDVQKDKRLVSHENAKKRHSWQKRSNIHQKRRGR